MEPAKGGYREKLEAALARYQRDAGERPDWTLLDPGRPDVHRAYRAFAREPFRIDLRPGAGEELALRLGLKPALRLLSARSGWPARKAHFESLGFAVAAAPEPLWENAVDGAVGPAPEGAEGTRLLAAVGRDPAAVEEVLRVDAELRATRSQGPRWRELTLRLGQLLGYPDCCAAAFADLGAHEHNLVPVRAAAGRSLAFHPLLDNLSLSAFHLTAWFPCRYDCAASLRLAEVLEGHLARVRPEAHREVRRYLSMPRLYADDRRQILFHGEALEGQRVRYRSVHTPYAFDRRTEEAAYEWIFFASVVAPLFEGDEVTLGREELTVERGGVVVRRVRRPPGSVWLPFRYPDGPAPRAP